MTIADEFVCETLEAAAVERGIGEETLGVVCGWHAYPSAK